MEMMDKDHNDEFKPESAIIPGLSAEESKKAAELIQRTYRGHRARRQVQGFGLDAETRWYEAVKDAQYQQFTTPAADGIGDPKSKWRHVTHIAKRAGEDDVSVSDVSTDQESTDAEVRQKKAYAIAERKKTAKMMDLQYFLEMVDQKHRYGSNLRKYHAFWRTQDTNQSFFYWLDYGEGKEVEVPECSRARLDKMQVRYLSREERLYYLVKVDNEGLLVWAKNGERVWTKDELYKDSIHGIVPVSDPTPKYKYNVKPDDSSSEDDSDIDNTAGDEGEQYVNEDFHRASGPAKLKHVSAAVLFNHMVRDSLKKGRKWIFVADTSFRLYIGYKQSGAFQHSSFLHGSRILAAGLIKVKKGQLRNLAPLSGHYRPPVGNFRAFVHALRDEGVDMSRVSISKSYAVLVGLESYTKTTNKLEEAEKSAVHETDKVFRPEKAKEDEARKQDTSQSAEKERLYLEQQRLKQEEEQRNMPRSRRMSSKIKGALSRLTGRKDDELTINQRVPGSGPEDGVPAPEGAR